MFGKSRYTPTTNGQVVNTVRRVIKGIYLQACVIALCIEVICCVSECQFVQEAKIDVLYLIDHRSSNRNMEFLRQSGERYLNQDIRLINSEITLLQPLNHRLGPDTSYHATVGGCAILTFGSLSHITFPTLSEEFHISVRASVVN